ncbi:MULTISPECIES: LPD28 domain-containing protein, partial [Bacteroidales]
PKKQRVMSRVHYLEGDYEQLVINETIDGLFSSYRIDRNSLPKGFFLYEIRWDDSLSSLAEISPSVVVNHAGSFITKSPLEFDANNSIRITYTNFIEFCQFGEWAYEKLAVLDCNSGNVAVISPDRRLQTTEEIEIFLSGHCGYHLSEINWMVMKGDVLFLNENDF